MSPHLRLLNFITLVYHCLKKILHVKIIFFISLIFLSINHNAFATDFSDKTETTIWCSANTGTKTGSMYSSVDECVLHMYRANSEPAKPQYILNKFADQIENLAITVNQKLRDYTREFFLFLATIGIFWSMYSLLFKEPSLNAFLYEMIRLLLTIGFFYFIITNMPVTLMKLGNDFVEFAGKVSPSSVSSMQEGSADILVNAYNLSGDILKTIAWTDGLNGMIFVKLGCAVCTMIIGFFIALNWTLAQLQYMVTCCFGFFLLGFAITPWTRDTALSYLKSLLAQSFKLFAKALCIAITNTVLTEFATSLTPESSSGGDDVIYIYNCLNLALSIYMGYIICDKIPDALANLIAPISSAKGNLMGAMISGLAVAGGVAGGATRIGGSLLGRGASGVMGALRSK